MWFCVISQVSAAVVFSVDPSEDGDADADAAAHELLTLRNEIGWRHAEGCMPYSLADHELDLVRRLQNATTSSRSGSSSVSRNSVHGSHSNSDGSGSGSDGGGSDGGGGGGGGGDRDAGGARVETARDGQDGEIDVGGPGSAIDNEAEREPASTKRVADGEVGSSSAITVLVKPQVCSCHL